MQIVQQRQISITQMTGTRSDQHYKIRQSPTQLLTYLLNSLNLLLYSQTHLSGQHWDLLMSIHLGSVSTSPCFILYIVSKRDRTNDIHLSGLSLAQQITFCQEQELDLENEVSPAVAQPPGTLFLPTAMTLLTPIHSENKSVLYDRAYHWLLLALMDVLYSGALQISRWLIDWST